jgi:hypothetical protein
MAERLFRCDGKRILPHVCSPEHSLELHEALYSRADMPKSKQAYAFDEHNVLLLCSGFHQQYGHSKWFRSKAAELLCTYYGSEAVQFYLENAPLKVPLLLEQLLWSVDPAPEV